MLLGGLALRSGAGQMLQAVPELAVRVPTTGTDARTVQQRVNAARSRSAHAFARLTTHRSPIHY